MRGWRRIAGSTISALNGVVKKVIPAPGGFRIIMYHAVGSAVPGDVYNQYNITPKRFKEHMQVLSEFTLEGVARLGQMPAQGLAITFDDGYRDSLEVVAPILTKLNIPFTVFITPSFVLSGQPIYISVAGIRELAKMPGVSIGAHGYSHCRLTECNNHRLNEELINSRKWLEDILGQSVITMSYPYGAVNQRVRNAVAAAGYFSAASSKFGTNLRDYDRLWLARTDIWTQDDCRTFRAKLAGNWDWLRIISHE